MGTSAYMARGTTVVFNGASQNKIRERSVKRIEFKTNMSIEPFSLDIGSITVESDSSHKIVLLDN